MKKLERKNEVEDLHAAKRDRKLRKAKHPSDNRSSIKLIARLSKKLK